MAKVLYHITMSLGGAFTGLHPRRRPGKAVTAASAAAGDGYVAVLGATTARRCLEAGLLDEVLVHVAPVLLGDGVRLFDHPGGTRVRLEPLELSSAGPIGNCWYRVA